MAELISGPLRATALASTILGQSKNFLQAEVLIIVIILLTRMRAD